MEIKLDDIGTEVQIQWDINDKDNDKLYLNTTVACFKGSNGEPLPSGHFYLTMPIKTAEKLLEKLTELVGMVKV